jgi:hypothetical protein
MAFVSQSVRQISRQSVLLHLVAVFTADMSKPSVKMIKAVSVMTETYMAPDKHFGCEFLRVRPEKARQRLSLSWLTIWMVCRLFFRAQ